MAIDLHRAEFIYTHHALVLPGSLSFHTRTLTSLLCGLQCSALTHAPAVSAQVTRRKYKIVLKDSGSVRRTHEMTTHAYYLGAQHSL